MKSPYRIRQQVQRGTRSAERGAINQNPPAPHPLSVARDGSALIVVLALLGALTLLGFLVLSLSSQEELNAEYFADAAKAPDIAALSPDAMFNFVLRQVIIGPHESEYNTALWGGTKSLVPTMVGLDMHPFNGRGINLMWDTAAGKARVDQDFDNQYTDEDGGAGEPDNQGLLDWNHSPAANGALVNLSGHPAPDVDYTSPDINSPFLSYEIEIPTNPPGASYRVRVPSFDRPVYLRNETADPTTWHSAAATQKRMLRPHELHMAYPTNWDVTTASATRRFINAGNNTVSGLPDIDDPDGNSFTIADDPAEPHVSGPFPFVTMDGATFAQGVWTGNGNTYILNADADGDGVNEAVYIDFGFPIQQTPSGTEFFVPMAAITIIDADALFNANVHSNINALAANLDLTANPFGANELISRSNQGISTSEVNMQYALYAAPTPASTDFAGDSTALAAALEQHRLFFGHDPATPVELSNMELWFLMAGRAEFSGGGALANVVEMHAGRHGELNRLSSGIGAPSRDATNFSFAGTSGVDDNNNLVEQGAYPGGGGQGFPNLVTLGPFGHPLDLFGTGSMLDLVVDQYAKTRALVQVDPDPINPGPLSPQQFPLYDNYRSTSDLAYLQASSAAELMPGHVPATQTDEEAETLHEPSLAATQSDDAILDASENASTHLHSNDITSTGFAGRLLELAPFNMRTSLRNYAIRRQIAATSWDPLAYGKMSLDWRDNDPLNAFRTWEWNVDTDNDQNREFPPQFWTDANSNSILESGEEIPVGSALDPFRPELRALLNIENGERTVKRPQRKLDINGVLDTTAAGRLRFRPLTPHPTTGLDNAQITAADAVASPSQITNARQQEYLARRDRQLMCRDIYVMLYTFGGGNDGLDYSASNASFTLYTTTDDPMTANIDENYTRRMAQMAVNWVDRLDPDDTVTVFEYDNNLGDGWQLDDNPYTTAEWGTDGAVVYGVESQKLAISEALLFLAAQWLDDSTNGANHGGTNIDETVSRDFSFLELENVSPFDVNFNENWQIVVKAKPVSPPPLTPIITEERRLTLLAGNTALNAANVNGPRFTIATAGDTHLKDTDATPLPTQFVIRPYCGEPTEPPSTDAAYWYRVTPDPAAVNLDLMKQQIRYRISKAGAVNAAGDGDTITGSSTEPSGKDLLHLVETAPDTLDETALASLVSGDASVRIELRRRANLNRQAPVENLDGTDASNETAHETQSADNPWITVDYADVPLQVFRIPQGVEDTDATAGTKIREQVIEIDSSQRYQPLDGHQLAIGGNRLWEAADKLPVSPAQIPATPTNSLGAANQASVELLAVNANKFSLWQSHYDRDYASAVELFDVPTYGPTELTRSLGQGSTRSSPEMSNFDDTKTAGYVFVNPDNPLTTVGGVDNGDNRWYRLLGLVEVPSRLHRQFDNPWYSVDAQGLAGDPIGFYRVPGKINLNTLRHPAVLAGLLDDMNVMAFNPNVTPQTLVDRVEAARDWYEQFMLSRDGLDSITNLQLPGLPSRGPTEFGRPFRSLGFSARGLTSMEDTILRQIQSDGVQAPPNTARRLFELGTLDEHNGVAAPVHPSVRHRLLQKVLNNTTTRSNVFLIFVQVDFFEAVEVTDTGGTGQPVVRIGAKRADSPGHRGFFVVDRSKALELLTPQNLPDVATTGSYSINQSFNYQSLILYRQTIK
ncbi:MAG: hypothetical protein WD648_11230 [Planctomycetaceae bacterium]